MKARTMAATAAAIAMAAPATATAQAKPSEDILASLRVCVQEALAMKAGVSMEDAPDGYRIMAGRIIETLEIGTIVEALEVAVPWFMESVASIGMFEGEKCTESFGIAAVESWLQAQLNAALRRHQKEADSEAAATGTSPLP